MNDQELLHQFVRERHEGAFRELVKRHIDMVYSAARRQVRNAASAEDVTQTVFATLATHASKVRAEILAGWLLTTTRYAALNTLRAQGRRQRHEREAAMNHREDQPANPQWNDISSLLDEAVATLKREDRDALALKFFQGKKVAEVAIALGISEEAAQKRVYRAVERLRTFFARHGINPSNATLTTLVAVNAVQSAPPALLAALSSASLASIAAGSASGMGKGLVTIMAWTKTQIAVASIAAVTAVTTAGVIVTKHLASPSLARQVQVPVTVPQPAPPGTNAQNLRLLGQAIVVNANANDWKPLFEQRYRLAPGENIKFVPAPFIPERLEYFRATAPAPQVKTIPRGTDSYLFIDDGQTLKDTVSRFGATDVKWVLERVLDVPACNVEAPQKVMRMQVAGDWVIRKDSSIDSRVAVVSAELSRLAGKKIDVRVQNLDREVIVARGKFAFKPLTPESRSPRANIVHIYRGEFTSIDNPLASSRGRNVTDMLQGTAEQFRIPVVIEADLSAEKLQRTEYIAHNSFSPRRDNRADSTFIKDILKNIAEQTSLEFSLETRNVPIWTLEGAS